MITHCYTEYENLSQESFTAFKKELIALCTKHRVRLETASNGVDILAELSDNPGCAELVNGDQ